MKRFITLALAVLALAAVPAALADDGTTTQPTTTTPAQQQTPATGATLKTRAELLRLRFQLLRLRVRVHCHGGKNADACAQFAQKVADRLTTLDGNVQKRIAAIQEACPTGSTDTNCRNADKKVALLQKIDARLQELAKRLQNGSTSTADSASQLGQLAGSNG
jgi:hypothetical protein